MRPAEIAPLLARFFAGAAVSVLAWLSVGSLAILIAFPLGLAVANRRRDAFAFAFGYFAINSAELPSILLRFFDGEGLALAIAAPLVLALILAAPFSFVARGEPLRRAVAMLAALAVITLPPVGFIGWLNPLFAAAPLFPGAGVIGLIMTALLFSVLSAWRKRTKKSGAVVLLAIIVPAASINAWYVNEVRTRPAILGVYASNTWLGKPDQTPAYRARAVAEISSATDWHTGDGFRLLILPESILHGFSDTDRVMLMPATNIKGRAEVLFGATLQRSDGRGENAVIRLDPNYPVVTTSRLPVPIGNWRPFMDSGVVARPFATDLIEIADLTAAVSVCYEDAVLWGHPGLMTGQSDILLSFANLWALQGTRTAHAQMVGANALARLGGVPLRRAVNQ